MSATDGALGPFGAVEEYSVQYEEYYYDPLPLGRYIRYLLLEPGGTEDPIACKLQTAGLDEAHFEAVSYVWGTSSLIERIRAMTKASISRKT